MLNLTGRVVNSVFVRYLRGLSDTRITNCKTRIVIYYDTNFSIECKCFPIEI